jgi:thiosulfate/3-mercaptopyruvate sulfurtransferase
MKYLLGYPSVKLYDGSWTEWGSIVGFPVEQ